MSAQLVAYVGCTAPGSGVYSQHHRLNLVSLSYLRALQEGDQHTALRSNLIKVPYDHKGR
jgi:hypothetical protein